MEIFLRLVTQGLAVTYLLMLSLPVSATTDMVWWQGYLRNDSRHQFGSQTA